ncbi:MAG TPA: HAD family phosphatase [Dehalococcoidia bacterium]|nr:HAD family phosphatase [Dehalococcoidia bacterium]
MTGSAYKLLVLDIDGTLLGKDGNILAEDREALARVSDSGIKVSLSTGRAVQACTQVLDELSLDGYHIFCDGALVYSPAYQSEVYVQALDKTVLKRAVEFAHVHEMGIDFYSATRYFVERETWSAVVHRDFFGIPPTVTDFDEICERETIIKAGLVATSPEEVTMARRFHLEFGDRLHFSWVTTPSYPGVDFINVVAPGVSKGRGLEALTAHLGITPAETVAIGDGNNDISLLSSAGLAVAMGNATSGAKEVADYVTLDVERGGVAAAIKKLLL